MLARPTEEIVRFIELLPYLQPGGGKMRLFSVLCQRAFAFFFPEVYVSTFFSSWTPVRPLRSALEENFLALFGGEMGPCRSHSNETRFLRQKSSKTNEFTAECVESREQFSTFLAFYRRNPRLTLRLHSSVWGDSRDICNLRS